MVFIVSGVTVLSAQSQRRSSVRRQNKAAKAKACTHNPHKRKIQARAEHFFSQPTCKKFTLTRPHCSTSPATIDDMDISLHTLVDRVRAATADGTALRIRGGGSKDFLADQLHGDVLDMTAHSGIVSYEPSELVVTARAGTPLAELEAALAEQGQCLPFEPPRFSVQAAQNNMTAAAVPLGTAPQGASYNSGTAAAVPSGTAPQGASYNSGTAAAVPSGTVGGMVAAGLSGPARASVGAARDYVLGLQMVNGKAEHLTFGGTVMKNVAGYDVSRLVAGSWGMLGVITEVSIKVLPVAPAEATLCFEMAQDKALAQLNHWGGQPLPLNASNWVQDNGQSLLFVRLRGAVAAVEAACQKMLAEHPGQRMDTAQSAADWTLCRDLQLPFFKQPPSPDACLWRISVPQTAPALNLPYAQLIDWHGAQRWLWAPASEGAHLRAVAQAAGGYATLFIAAQAEFTWVGSRFDAIKPPLDRIHRQLKAEFDPAGIFNPGRTPWFN
jgi:glycolate oxidase FAD binding subunit